MAAIADAIVDVGANGQWKAAQGTITADRAALSTTVTWNNAGVTFTHLKANVTDTASNAASLLIDLQVASASKFKVTKAGAVTQASSLTVSAGGVAVTGNSTITGTLTSLTGITSSGTAALATVTVSATATIGTSGGSVTALVVQGANANASIAKFARGGSEKPVYIAAAQNAEGILASEGELWFNTGITADTPFGTGTTTLKLTTTTAVFGSVAVSGITSLAIGGALTGATTGAFSGAVSLGNTVNSVSPTSPNRTVTIVIGGTTYYLHAKTTND